jgi:hypothetical protein
VSVVLACSSAQRTAWRLQVGGSGGDPLVGTSRRAARLARDHVAKWTPLAWRQLPPLDAVRAERVDVSVPNGGTAQSLPLVGDSLGLSVVLALTSAWLGLPVPPGLVASAALEPDGSLGAVGAVAGKVGLVTALLPGVRRIAVASCQEQEWRVALDDAGRADLELVAVPTVAAAIARFFSAEEALEQVPRGRDRRRLVYGLSALLERGQGVLPDWGAVASAVDRILAAWDLSGEDRPRLELLALVARRYSGLPLPPAPVGRSLGDLVGDVARRSPLERAGHLAHLVEHCAALALPLPAELEDAVAPLLDADRHPHDFKVRGAHARWLAPRDPVAALESQRARLAELRAARRLTDCSHSLTEALRLAGALGRGDAFAQLLDEEAALEELGGLSAVDRTFVNAAVAGGAALLGNRALSDGRWERLAHGEGPHRYLRSWALRLRLLAGVHEGDAGLLLGDHALLHAVFTGSKDVETAVAELRKGRPVAALLAQQGRDHLLRFFPY